MTPAQMERNRQLAEQKAEQERKNQEAATQREQQQQERLAQVAKENQLLKEIDEIKRFQIPNRGKISKDDFPKAVRYYELVQQYKEVHGIERNAMTSWDYEFDRYYQRFSSSQKKDFHKRFPEYTGKYAQR